MPGPVNVPMQLATAQVHLRQNRLPAAEATLRAALSQAPAAGPLTLLLSVVLFRQGRPAEAERELEPLFRQQPNNPEVIGLLTAFHMARQDFAGALPLLQRLIDLGQENADIYNHVGTCHLQLGDAVAAGNAFKRAIELDRTVSHSYYNLGLALKLAGNSFETFHTFRRAIELDPSFLDSYLQLWQQMRQLLNWSEGLPILEEGLRKHPTSVEMMVTVALTYGKAGQPEKAEGLFKQAIALDPLTTTPYAHWLQEKGRFEDSVPVLQQAIRVHPIQGQAYYNLSIAKCFEVDGRSLTEIVPPYIVDGRLVDEERMFLHYALARTYDQAKNYELAMREFDSANDLAYRLYNASLEHDAAAVEEEQRTLAELYSSDGISRLRRFGADDATPIFIVGMIRTGTTLLDQILSSHPLVRSAGEQPYWQIVSGRFNRRLTEPGDNASDIQTLARDYLDILREATGGAFRITDKMPINFMHVGLMSAAFPNAKFIHLRRNPVDTCLSIYTTFLGRGTKFAYNQDNILGYYRTYLQTMEHWRAVISADQMVEIDYEGLVSQKELVLRQLLPFLGLRWDDSVLHHEDNQAPVTTPSLWTARQPVNAASVERWRRYEPWLGKLSELKDVAHPPIV